MLHFPEIEASSHGEGVAGYVVCIISITCLNALLTVVAVEDVYTGPEVFQRVAVIPESQQSGTKNMPATAVVWSFSQTVIGLVPVGKY